MSTQANPSTPIPPTPISAAGRRFRYAAQAAVLGLSITLVCVLVTLLADRFPIRLDATATREHQLSAQTLATLDALKGEHEIVVAVNSSGVDPRAAQRTQDVFDTFTRACRNLTITVLDIASDTGLERLDAVLRRLSERSSGEIARYRATLTSLASSDASVVRQLEVLATDLAGVAPTITKPDANSEALRKFFTDSASFCRLSAKELSEAQEKSESVAKSTIARTPVPRLDDAIKLHRAPLANLSVQLGNIAEGLGALSRSTSDRVPQSLRDKAALLLDAVPPIRDQVARSLGAIDDLPRLAIASIARVLERSTAAIVIAPPGSPKGGVTGIDVGALFPPRAAAGITTSPIDTRARTEELLASALTAVSSQSTPIVVLVHGEPARFAPTFQPISELAERLRLRGGDVMEWAAALDPEPPSTLAINPKNVRPVVYVSVSTFPGNQDAATRMLKLAAALKRLVESGKSVLVSVTPSPLPGTGQVDPMVEFLKPLGIEVDSGRPLMQQFTPATGRVVSADLFPTDPKADHPISGPLRGLVTRLPWVTPIRVTKPAGGGLAPIIVIEDFGASIWGESEWLEFRRVPPAQRATIANPPARADTSRDDLAGPWTAAIAIERPRSTDPGASTEPQRLVVVGSNGWFLDDLAQGSTMVDGRPVLFNPGNAELFDACVAWLSGNDASIATGSQAQSAGLIPNLTEGSVTLLRWSLVAGLPLLILGLGATLRIARG